MSTINKKNRNVARNHIKKNRRKEQIYKNDYEESE